MKIANLNTGLTSLSFNDKQLVFICASKKKKGGPKFMVYIMSNVTSHHDNYYAEKFAKQLVHGF